MTMKILHKSYIFYALIFILIGSDLIKGQQWESEIVHYNESEKLIYERDIEGNCIPDFSYAGYKNSNEVIPVVQVLKTISPVEGDNTQHIQNALFELGIKAKNADGFRGALLLMPGIYEIKGTIKLQFDGVVLRGSGDGENPDSNTILSATGNSPSQRTVLIAGGGADTKWKHQVSGTKKNIISDTVLIGENSFDIENTSGYSVGDNIIIYHPCTKAWLEEIDFGGTHSDEPGAEAGVDISWTEGSHPLVFNRYITAIEGNRITIDVPVFNHLIKSLSQAYIYKYARTNLLTNIGIEDLRIDIKTNGQQWDEAHAWNAIDMFLIEDAWIKNCTMLHFGLSGVRTNSASRITVEDCHALDPISEVVGGNRYNYQVYTASQQILFKNCHASNGRHHYISNGYSFNSGIVFYNCTSEGSFASSEGHRGWSMGFLWDNYKELDGPRPGYNPRLLGLYNRGHYGTSHGWGIAHSVAWNCDVNNGDLVVQKPPTAQNYAIGCSGKNITGINSPSLFNEPEGFIERSNEPGINPGSLYAAQLKERLTGIVSVQINMESIVLEKFDLYQNYPNPFNSVTHIQYQITSPTFVKIRIIDSLGKTIITLVNENKNSGIHSAEWSGCNSEGMQISSGVYMSILETDFGSKSKKMILLK